MRHRKSTKRLGRSSSHLKATSASLVCGLIEERRITTTVAKARMTRRLAEKMVTLVRKGTLAARRQAIAFLKRTQSVDILIRDILPAMSGRQGGYTRIMKLSGRRKDSSEMAILEWVGIVAPDKKRKKKAGKGEEAAAKEAKKPDA